MEYTSAARLETRASHISSVLFRIRWFQKAAEREAHKILSSGSSLCCAATTKG